MKKNIEEIEQLKKIKKNHPELSIEKIAKEMKVSWFTVQRWLKGKRKPSDLALIQIRKFLEKY